MVETTASLSMEDFEGIVDGDSLFRAACLPESFSSEKDSNRGVSVAHDSSFGSDIPSTGAANFPAPVIRHQKDLVRGYYLNGDKQDVSILQLPTFKLDGQIASGISLIVKEFITQSLTDGKRKLVIDMSGNGGGDVNIGFNIFRILFPNVPIETWTRFRRTELINLMGKVFSSNQARAKYGEDFPLDLPLAAHFAVRPDQQQGFESWEELYGSAGIVSEPYATFNFTTASTEEDPIEGCGGIPQAYTSQPFDTDNIILVCLYTLGPGRHLY